MQAMSQEPGQPAASEGRDGRGWGGRRPGAGRPAGRKYTPIRGDFDYAREFVSSTMRDESQPLAVRTRCAVVILTQGHRCRSWAGSGRPIDSSSDTAIPGTPGGNPATEGPDGPSPT
jgi:hypothetical protein